MKNLILVFFVFSSLFSVSQSKMATIMPARTIGAIQTIDKSIKKYGNNLPKNLCREFSISKFNGEYYIDIIAKKNTAFDSSRALENNIIINSTIGDIVTMKIPLSQFKLDFNFPGIIYMETSTLMEPYLDGAILDIRADSVHQGINLPQSYTGKNVLIGVVDWGFEYIHPTFYDTTITQNRIISAWDQVKVGTPPNGFNYGTEYSSTLALETAQRDTFSFVSDMHGTHVAGIAGGAGAGTAYRGVAFESDLIFVQMNGHASYSLDAYQYLFNKSQQLGKRLVVNNSFGSIRDNPLDGTSLFSQAMEAYIDSGVVFCVSAGNSGGSGFHIKNTFTNDSIRTRVGGFNYASDPNLWGETIQMWGEQGENFAAKIRIIGGTNTTIMETPFFNTSTALPFLDTFMNFGTDTVWYKVTVDAIHPNNGRPQMKIDVKMPSSNDKCILISEANSGTVHYWNSRLTINGGGNTAYPFISFGSGYTVGNSEYAIGHPSVTSGVISVAAHNTNNNITSFSSRGPRMDESEKPDISAPGANIASALNSAAAGNYSPVATVNFNGNDYDFVRLSGTSMSCPMTVGTVALMLEANPNLTPAEVKDLIKYTAYEDSFTGTIIGHSTTWGRGKLDAYNAVNTVFTVAVEELTYNNQYSVFPNPFNDFLTIENLNGDEQIEVYTMDGKRLFYYNSLVSNLNLNSLTNGFYILRIESKENIEEFKIIKQ